MSFLSDFFRRQPLLFWACLLFDAMWVIVTLCWEDADALFLFFGLGWIVFATAALVLAGFYTKDWGGVRGQPLECNW